MATKMIAINTIQHVVDGKVVETARYGEFETDAKTARDLALSGAAKYADPERQSKLEDAPKDSVPASGNKAAPAVVTQNAKSKAD